VDVVEGGENVVVDEMEDVLGTKNGDENGGGEDGGRGNSKISTIFEYPLFQVVPPPPKNILF
jgi:hypothetical protein